MNHSGSGDSDQLCHDVPERLAGDGRDRFLRRRQPRRDGVGPERAEFGMPSPTGTIRPASSNSTIPSTTTAPSSRPATTSPASADWSAYTAIFDAAGNETHETDFYSDGTRAETAWDLSGQNWESVTNWHDGAGHLEFVDTLYDNGTAIEVGYNASGTGRLDLLCDELRPQSQLGARDRLLRRRHPHRDGVGPERAELDTTIDWYDAAGQLMLHDVNYDDGRCRSTLLAGANLAAAGSLAMRQGRRSGEPP